MIIYLKIVYARQGESYYYYSLTTTKIYLNCNTAKTIHEILKNSLKLFQVINQAEEIQKEIIYQ